MASRHRPAAAVVGLCAHGLAIVRALARHGVPVHAVEADPSLPGFRTRLATVHRVEAVNAPALVSGLMRVARRIPGPERPVLFLTNDHMVRIAGTHWPELSAAYRLSWGHCAEALLTYLEKNSLEARCRSIGAAYPSTRTLDCIEDLDCSPIEFPVLVKPVRPLSSFKVRLARTPEALAELVRTRRGDLPLLLQQWIGGDDRCLRFGALYLDRGRALARFEGRKLRSMPPALGGTTVAEAFADDMVHARAQAFFDGLELSGPVSLEVKLDREGRPWVIEPTVGRTDYWLDCCTTNGVDLPYIEYCHVAGLPLPATKAGNRAIWIDTERDPGCLVSNARDLLRAWVAGRKLVFPYFHSFDPAPWRTALARQGRLFSERLARRFGARVSPRG